MAVFNNALAGAAGSGGAADFQIERSLRFNSGDSAYLDRSPQTAGNRKKWTWSGWIKTTTSSTYRALIEGYGGTPAGANRTSFQLNNVGKLHILFDNGNSGQLLTSRIYRDPSSWFHVVLAVDTSQIAPINRVKIYVNGELLESSDYDTESYPTQEYLTGINNNQTHYINRVIDPKWGDWYAADIHLVDGQQLAATDFGEFDADTGVWNPKRYSGSHGTNGFHLDFSDDSSVAALGYDAAGSNNWDVYNLGVSNVSYTNNLTSQSLDTSVRSGSVSNIFNGDTTDMYEWNVAGTNSGDSGTFTITFSPALNVSSGLRVHAWLNDNQYDKHGISINGGSFYYPNIYDGSNQWHDLLDTSYSNNTGFTGGTLNTLSFKTVVDMNGQNPSGWVRAIEVNGVQLTDSDIDVSRDSPTNYDDGTNIGGNYATFNALDCDNGTLSNGNLTTNQSNTSVKFGPQNTTMGFSSGKWYCEFTWDSGTYALVGITHQPSAGLTGTTWHRDAETYTWYFSGAFMSIAWPGTSTFPDGSNPTFTAGDVIGVLLDKDNDKLYFTKNGSYVASMNAATGANGIDISAHSGKTAFFTVGNNASTATQWTLNAGQRPFAASSIPTGYKALCTQNLDDPLIANSSTAFQTKLWTGNQSARSITTTGMGPDLVWIKSRSHATWHELFDTVRGPLKQLYSNETNAEATTADTLTAFNTDGFSLGSNNGVNGANTRTYVGWAWDAGANSNRTYTVTVVSDSGNKYRFDGHGTSAVTLNLEEGSTYTFDQSDSSNSGHPLRFSTTSDGTHGGGSEYTTGVTATGTPGTAGAKTTIVVASGAPTLYYYCSAHSGMGGQLNTNSTAGSTVLTGSLNSSAYNTSRVWSNDWTANVYYSTYNATKVFDGDNSTGVAVTYPSTSTNIAVSPAISGSVIRVLYSKDNSSTVGTINGSETLPSTGSSATYVWRTLAATSISSIQLAHDNSGSSYIRAIEVDGKILLDQGVSAVDNFPSISSTCRTNQTAGISIVSWTGNGANGAATVAHNLNAPVDFMIIKRRSGGSASWPVWWSAFESSGNTDYFFLDAPDVKGNGSYDFWNNLTPTSSFFHISSNTNLNAQNDPIIGYIFSSVDGFSKFGKYQGGSSPFIYTGFRPAFVAVKGAHSSHWLMMDAARDPFNDMEKHLHPNLANGEATAADRMDFVSNGFKIRANYGETGDAQTYYYLAFAESPFKYSRAR